MTKKKNISGTQPIRTTKGVLRKASSGLQSGRRVKFNKELSFSGTEKKMKMKVDKDLRDSDCKYLISPCTLRVNDVVLNNDFELFKCEKTQKNGLGILIVFAIILVALLLLSAFEDQEQLRFEYIHHMILFGAPTILLAFFLFFSSVEHRFALLIGPVLTLSLAICIFAVNLKVEPEKITNTCRSSQMSTIVIFYFIQAGLFNVRFVEHLVTRVLFLWAALALVIAKSA